MNEKHKILMSPAVKLGNEAKREQKRGRDKIVKRILTHQLNYRPLVAPSHSIRCSVPPAVVSWKERPLICGSESLQSDRTLRSTVVHCAGPCGRVRV